MTDPAGIPTARAVDHYAFTVPDLDAAVTLFTEAFGARLCYREGPIEHPDNDWMERKLGVHPRASARIALMRFAGSNLEIFEYSAVEQQRTAPALRRPGGHYIAISVTDRDRVVGELCADPRIQLVAPGEPRVAEDAAADADGEETVWLTTHWGMRVAITDRAARIPGAFRPPVPDPQTARPGFIGIDHAGYTVADLSVAESFFRDVLGARLLVHGRVSIEGELLDRTVVRVGPTANIALLAAEVGEAGGVGGVGAATSVRNSDVGGHHLAINVDDVDAAAAYLSGQAGVDVMGQPETVAAGPIAGDRWVYFTTPIGLQMEIINMPDGRLPYERTTSARRAVPPLATTWNEYS
jgi:catechol 2,3-dioxygenase-like lactoylglutathione lyase family enzyme